ncbi:hypothetical protein CDD83_3666 [Cordyceps sp. RAO-2017]|nr:hypothetical protein CDD83_3666 [Cordyceps sp. RAO-2017]
MLWPTLSSSVHESKPRSQVENPYPMRLRHLQRTTTGNLTVRTDTMCDWEEFLYSCNHSVLRLKSYCHFARNEPDHQCYGVKVLRNSWQQGVLCEKCTAQCQAANTKTQDSSPKQAVV